ncbi:MAG: cell wall hydrolase, partial [Pseudomonadota bacterium]
MLRQFTLRQIKRAIAIGSLVLVGGGFSAHAALIVLKVAAERERAAAVRAAGFDVQDHFPGAALLYPADAQPAPAVGATGTTALPVGPLPEGADASAGDASVRPAQPFTMAGASPLARDRAQRCLTNAIYYEAASESDDGQRAVAQVVLNRVRHPAFPASVCGVVFQGAERTTGCQFSFACDGSMARIPSRAGWARASRFAADALAGRVLAAVGEATHYHTYAVTPSWNKSLVMTAAIGAHFFHRWKGWWGTPPAFRQSYAGAEPFAGPHPRAAVAV